MSDDDRRAGELAGEILDLLERDSVSAALAVVQDPEALALARTEPVLQQAALAAWLALSGRMAAALAVPRALWDAALGRDPARVTR